MPATVDAMLQLYYQRKIPVMSRDTIDRVLNNTQMYARDISITRVDEITTENIIEWGQRKLEDGDICQSTLATYYNSLRAFVSFLATCGIDLAIDYKKISCASKYRDKRILRPDQIRRVIRHADPQTQILIRLLFTSGMRISEAVSIENEHLLDDVVIYVKGKGQKTRPVVVTKELLYELRTLSMIHGGACFVDKEGNKLTRKKAYYAIKKAGSSAGYPWVTPHTYRHSYCTDLLRKGGELSHVSKMMGHSDVSVTQVYTHLVTDDIVKTHRLLSIV